MPETITAREFLLNTFDTSFLNEAEKNTIISAMELFAKGKCAEQVTNCVESLREYPSSENGDLTNVIRVILRAPVPIF